MKYANITETIGRTPLVKVSKLAPPHVNLYVKLEAFNPMGSVKDRLAISVIEDAERSGKLKPGQTVVEATSGNTGIGLAMVCAQRGYPLVIVMAENFSVERRKLMRFLGAKVVLTPAAERGSGMLLKAVELAETHGWFLPRQFENEANADVHSRTTAVEILEDFKDERLDYWVTGFGTGGTLKGVARVLRQKRPDTRIIVCEPDNSALLGSGIAQAKTDSGQPAGAHPSFRPHLMQGWSPDFISRLTEDAVSQNLIDRTIPINGRKALQAAKDLASREGIFTGITGGATLVGAIEVSQDAPAGSNIVCMLPDTGERYISTPLFADIQADMSEEEVALSKSTPNYRFDVRPPAPAAPAAPVVTEAPQIDPASLDFVRAAVNDPQNPVVMFALEWCEFCWAARNMLTHLGIPYRSVDLDSVEYQEGNRGGMIRTALISETDFKTIPQIFVGGTFIGGSTDLFDAYRAGKVQDLLKKQKVKYKDIPDLDPYTFLPKWLQSRAM